MSTLETTAAELFPSREAVGEGVARLLCQLMLASELRHEEAKEWALRGLTTILRNVLDRAYDNPEVLPGSGTVTLH